MGDEQEEKDFDETKEVDVEGIGDEFEEEPDDDELGTVEEESEF